MVGVGVGIIVVVTPMVLVLVLGLVVVATSTNPIDKRRSSCIVIRKRIVLLLLLVIERDENIFVHHDRSTYQSNDSPPNKHASVNVAVAIGGFVVCPRRACCFRCFQTKVNKVVVVVQKGCLFHIVIVVIQGSSRTSTPLIINVVDVVDSSIVFCGCTPPFVVLFSFGSSSSMPPSTVVGDSGPGIFLLPGVLAIVMAMTTIVTTVVATMAVATIQTQRL